MEAEDGSGHNAAGDGVPVAIADPKAAKAKKEPKEEPAGSGSDDEDDIPLQKSIRKKNADVGNLSRIEREEIADDSGSKNLKKIKKEEGKSSAKPVKVNKKDPDALEKDLKDKMQTHNPSKKKKEEIHENGGSKSQKAVKKEETKTSMKTIKAKKSDNGLSEDDSEDGKKNTKNKNKREEEEKEVGKKLKKSTANVKAKEKKVYDLPGQKHDPPEEREPLRIFYETLYKQVPNSEMAAFWMMEWGLLSKEEAKKVYEKKLKKGQQQKLASPTKTISSKKTSSQTVKVTEKTSKNMVKEIEKVKAEAKTSNKKRKPSSSESDEDDDFIIARRQPKKTKVSR